MLAGLNHGTESESKFEFKSDRNSLNAKRERERGVGGLDERVHEQCPIL